MTRQSAIARRAEQLLGTAVVATAPVAGGDINTATRLRLSDGRMVLMKTHPNAPADFFEAEARGLGLLGTATGAGGVPVPEVLAVHEDCLLLPWIEPGRPTTEAAAELGRSLARTHAFGAQAFGGVADGYIGRLPMPNGAGGTWAEFYAVRRIQPYLKLARDRAAVTPEEAATIEALLPRLGGLVPEEPPALLHGDLWNGNVLWSAAGPAYAIDPATHGGHRETDLAMLALFGLPLLPQVLDAYQQVSPLADGWQERVGLHQLFPLLVHACLFGGGYGARAARVAAAFT